MQLRSATNHPASLARFARLVVRPALLVVAFLMLAASAWALERGADGWFHTGDGVRVKKVAFVNIDVYAIAHDMKELPTEKSKQAVINMDTDKRFTWRMLRDVDKDKIQAATREAFATNGFTDQARIGSYVGAFSSDLQKGAAVTIKYDATAKAVTVTAAGGGTATVPGVDFMHAVWSLYFGKNDQPALGDALIRNM